MFSVENSIKLVFEVMQGKLSNRLRYQTSVLDLGVTLRYKIYVSDFGVSDLAIKLRYKTYVSDLGVTLWYMI